MMSLRYKSKKTRTVIHRTAMAAECIGPLGAGDKVTGITAGQFSAIDALEYLASEMQDADISVSTWTTGIYDVQRSKLLQEKGNIKSIRFLLDRATFEKSPKYAAPMIDAFGVDSFRCMSIHSKVIIVKGVKNSCVFRSSMNLNKNLRTEQFDIDVSDVITGFYLKWFDELWKESGLLNDNRAIIKAVYDRLEHGAEKTSMDRMWCDSPRNKVKWQDRARHGDKPWEF